MKLSEKCRACLSMLGDLQHSVYEEIQIENIKNAQRFCDMIVTITGVSITENDVTTSICSTCAIDVIKAFSFREKVISVNINTIFIPTAPSAIIDEQEYQTKIDIDPVNNYDWEINSDELEYLSDISQENKDKHVHMEENEIDLCNWYTDNENLEELEYSDIESDGDEKPTYENAKRRSIPYRYIFECPICQKLIPMRPNFCHHLLVHVICSKFENDVSVNQELYKCELCDFSDDTQRKMMNHLLKNHVPNSRKDLPKLLCEYCGKVTVKHANHRSHLATHTGGDFICDICGKKYATAFNLKVHKEEKHLDEMRKDPKFTKTAKLKSKRRFNCHLCTKSYSQKFNLNNHLGDVHNLFLTKHTLRKKERNDMEPIMADCKICGKVVAEVSLNNHIRLVHGEKKHKCSSCSYKSSVRKNLNRHIRNVHQRLTPYECTICDKKFAEKFTCEMHIKTHTGHPYAEEKYKRPNRKRQRQI